jgi:hypothetical protein
LGSDFSPAFQFIMGEAQGVMFAKSLYFSVTPLLSGAIGDHNHQTALFGRILVDLDAISLLQHSRHLSIDVQSEEVVEQDSPNHGADPEQSAKCPIGEYQRPIPVKHGEPLVQPVHAGLD